MEEVLQHRLGKTVVVPFIALYLFVCFGGCSFNHSFIVVSFRTAGMKVNPYYRKLLWKSFWKKIFVVAFQAIQSLIMGAWAKREHCDNQNKGVSNSFHVFSLLLSCNRNTDKNLIEFWKKHHFLSLGTLAFDKLNSLLYTTSLVNDIKKLSPNAQTSCLEGFHATLNYWHPKMICYSWLGSTCRYLILMKHL